MGKKKIALIFSFIIFGLLLTFVRVDFNKVWAQQIQNYLTFQVIGNPNEAGGFRFVRQVNNQDLQDKFHFGWTKSGDPAFGIGESLFYDAANFQGRKGFFAYAVDPNSKDPLGNATRYSTISLYAPLTDANGGNGKIEFRQRVPLAPFSSYLPAFGQTPPSSLCQDPDCPKQLATKEYVDQRAAGGGLLGLISSPNGTFTVPAGITKIIVDISARLGDKYLNQDYSNGLEVKFYYNVGSAPVKNKRTYLTSLTIHAGNNNGGWLLLDSSNRSAEISVTPGSTLYFAVRKIRYGSACAPNQLASGYELSRGERSEISCRDVWPNDRTIPWDTDNNENINFPVWEFKGYRIFGY